MQYSIKNRYQQAQQLLDGMMSKSLVTNDAVFPHWLNNTMFWYKHDSASGKEFRLVDAVTSAIKPAFNHKQLAQALGEAAGANFNAKDLPILISEITRSPLEVKFTALDKQWQYSEKNSSCIEISIEASLGIASPDGQHEVVIKDHNIWLISNSNPEGRPLTHNGSAESVYGKVIFPYAGSGKKPPFEAIWSPDSRYIFTYRLDLERVKNRQRYLPAINDGSIDYEPYEERKAYPGDEVVESYRFVIIDILAGTSQDIDYPAVPVYSIGMEYFSTEGLGWWSADSARVFFVDVSRGCQSATVIALNPETAEATALIKEQADTFIKLSHCLFPEPAILQPLPESSELIWFSEREGCGHLYLYDLHTGQLKHPITSGQWVVRNILHVDHGRRELLIQTSGRDKGQSPYYQDICRVNIDTGELVTLKAGPYEHVVYVRDRLQTTLKVLCGQEALGVHAISPGGDYLVVTQSRVDTLPVSILIDRSGNDIHIVEQADNVGLPPQWSWPEPFSIKATDNQTDLYGVLFRPPMYSEANAYPVLDYSNTAYFTSSLPQGSFINDVYFGETYITASAYAALGFMVVVMDVPGMPCREKSFHEKHYGSISYINGIEERIHGIQQLASRYPAMDINRVGIVGYDSDAGPMQAMLEQPQFYKVGVSIEPTDPRFGFPATPLVEMYGGVKRAPSLYNAETIASLQGRLLLTHGLRSSRPPEMTLLLVDALQKQQKDFDLLIEPAGVHFVTSNTLHRVWDYLVRHLLHAEPPKDFELVNCGDRFEKELQKSLEENSQYDLIYK